MSKAKATLAGSTAEGFNSFTGLQRDDVHSLSGGINDVDILGLVAGMAGLALCRDAGLNGTPV